jgi:hypothetical protein
MQHMRSYLEFRFRQRHISDDERISLRCVFLHFVYIDGFIPLVYLLAFIFVVFLRYVSNPPLRGL